MKKCKIHIDLVFISHDQSFESADPSYGSFNRPMSSIASFDLTILDVMIRSVFPVWDQQTDTSFFESAPERIAVVRLVGYDLLGSRPGPSRTGSGDANLIQCCFSERNLSRRGSDCVYCQAQSGS